MESEYKAILEAARSILSKKSFSDLSVSLLADEAGVTPEKINKYFSSVPDFFDKLLEYERKSYEEIFETYNFDNLNSIDIVLIVSHEVHDRFYYVNPSITFEISRFFPDIFQKHIVEKREFMYNKLKANIVNGINEGLYRNDLDPDATTSEFIDLFLDIHLPEKMPEGGYSFGMIFENLFDRLIHMVANENGLSYYYSRRQLFDVMNFGR